MGTPIRWGREFQVNTTAPNNQMHPAVIGLADGRFVVTWQDDGHVGADTSGGAVRGQVFDAAGLRLGTEFLVNTATTGFQGDPSIAALADGGFIVTWTDASLSGSDISGTTILGQRFGTEAAKIGAPFTVNAEPAGNQADSSLTVLQDGRLLVVWDGPPSGADDWGAASYGRILNADGSAAGADFLVNTTTDSDQWRPVAAALTGGGFVVTWQDASQSGADWSGYAVRARVFDAAGTALGPDFVVNSHIAGWQADPDITALADGGFVVTWIDYQPATDDPSGQASRAQVYDAAGNRVGAEILVNTTTGANQSGPRIAALPDGRFVIAWTDDSMTVDDLGLAVKAQLFNADGTKSGAEFLVNATVEANQYLQSISALADGRFVLAWSDNSHLFGDKSGYAIRAQIFDPREAAVGLAGTALDDHFIGTRFDDTMAGAGGDDRLIGREGNDALTGDAGNDRLEGRLGDDTLTGGLGDDTLVAGFGNDLMTGGDGQDVFVFRRTGGADTVTDFTDGQDRIDLSDFGLADFAAVAARLTQTGADVVFTFHANTLTIENASLLQITASDMIL